MDEKKYLNFTNIRRDLVVLLCLTITGLALAADNPFLRIDIPDSGVLKYNGEYYLCGWTTKGYMYCSRNLVDWGNRTKAITHV